MKALFRFQIIAILFVTIPVYSQWVQQTLPGDIDVTLGIDFINQNHGVMGGWHFSISPDVVANAYYTTNAGTNWYEASFPDSMRVIVGIQMIDDLVAYGAGAYNLPSIATKQSGNRQTMNLYTPLRNFYEQIGMAPYSQDEYRGYFVESTDGGQSWHPKGSIEDSVYYLVGISFTNQQTGFVLGQGPIFGNSAILKTTDSGANWNFAYPFENGLYLNDIEFIDQLNGVVVGSYDDMVNFNGVVLKTNDGGNTWVKIILPSLAAINKVTYLNSNTLLLSGTNLVFQEVVYKSDDGGLTWNEFKNYGNLYSVHEVNSVIGTGVILIFGVHQPTGFAIPFSDVSFDNGLTWYYSEYAGFQDYYPFTTNMVDEYQWYVTGTQMLSQGFVLFTDNAGGVPVELVSFSAETFSGEVNLKWITATELNNLGFEVERRTAEEWITIGFVRGKGTTTEIQNYSFIDDLFGLIASNISYRLKQIDFNGTYNYSDVIEVSITPTLFTLEQNYPNPFNPSTNIGFRIADREFVSLNVYDVIGNEIATLVNEELPAGEYEVEFNASGLPSGLYFYKLKAGNFVETRKMVYLK